MAQKMPGTKALAVTSALPSNALALIHEYSRPITRPDWRERKWICVGDMYKEITNYKNVSTKYDIYYNLYNCFNKNVQGNLCWSHLYSCVLTMGLKNAAEECGITEHVLKKLINKN
jgi:hypothetical protein